MRSSRSIERASRRQRLVDAKHAKREPVSIADTCPRADTCSITPDWEDVIVTQHAIKRYAQRLGGVPSRAFWALRDTVCRGIRTDRDKEARAELREWLRWIVRDRLGRLPTLFLNQETGLCAVVVREQDGDKLVVLSCFVNTDAPEDPSLSFVSWN